MTSVYSSDELAAANVAFALTSHLVHVEPNTELIASFIKEDMFYEAPYGADNEAVQNGLALLSAWCNRSRTSEELTEDVASLQREWLKMFIGLGTPEVPCGESFWRDPNRQLLSNYTLEVRKVYQRYNIQITNKGSEPDDNLGLMLGFIAELLTIEQKAKVNGDSSKEQTVAADMKSFLSGHILPWLSAWRHGVATYARSDYYKGVGELVFGFCETLALRFGIIYHIETYSFAEKRS